MSFIKHMMAIAERLLCDKCLAQYKAAYPYFVRIEDFCPRCVPKFALDSDAYNTAFTETLDEN
jgi:hypothetical protein